MSHRTRIEPVPVPEWTLHQPRCSCGWRGDLLRTRPLAADQADEHLAEEHPATETEQPALFGDDLEV
ncbi:hypothetical protein DFP74_6700 [Nocardiopsis sp. Huas11]|uniref:hypothetical protein n=1 Tax=Nocardiopsis sp. Huas11 TaxID=2183912 RepID=UPI000EB469E3|nr:hypothetical protein [Nocardiopsis sp. Huas11]RKR98979.1 hypothetical protein DFP74_6700 [Nocardiopsis sp. Huas11]